MTETIVWQDPSGSTITLLGGSGYRVAWNLSGRFSPAWRYEQEGVPDQDGMQLRGVLSDARELLLPVWVEGSSESDLRQKIRTLVSSMNPKRGDGMIRVTTPVGDQREIVCRIASGFDGSERAGDTSTLKAQLFPLTFRAWEPYWRNVSDTTASYTTGSAPGGFFPFFPIVLASSEIFASEVVTNAGDVDAWPVWTVNGPGSSITLRNMTTGKSLSLATTLAAGESVVVDTRPLHKTVTRSDGTNLYSLLTSTSSFWPLQRGGNTIRVEMVSSTTASSVTLAWRQRYLGV